MPALLVKQVQTRILHVLKITTKTIVFLFNQSSVAWHCQGKTVHDVIYIMYVFDIINSSSIRNTKSKHVTIRNAEYSLLLLFKV